MAFSTLLRSLFWCFLGTRLRGPRGKGTLRGHQRQRARARTLRPASPGGRARPLQLRREGLSPGFSQFCTSSKLNSFCHACCQTPLRSPLPTAAPGPGLSQHRAGSWDNAGLSCTGGLHSGVLDHVFNCKQPGQARDSTADLDLRWEQCGGGGLVTETCGHPWP